MNLILLMFHFVQPCFPSMRKVQAFDPLFIEEIILNKDSLITLQLEYYKDSIIAFRYIASISALAQRFGIFGTDPPRGRRDDIIKSARLWTVDML